MREVTRDECKRLQLNILINVAKFCEDHDIKYSLAYGTLIGAIRHKGFIPWDDDIDIIMMRKEYERFVALYKDDKYKLIRGENMNNHLHVVVSDMSTTLRFPNSLANTKFYKGGVWVDIFPIDRVPDNPHKYVKLMKKIWLFMRLQRIGEIKYPNSMLAVRLAHPLIWPFRNIFGTIGKKIMYHSNNRISRTVANLSLWYLHYPSFPLSYMNEYVDVEFEQNSFKAMKEYDGFLRGVYGDYMQLPPENERVPRHSYIAYWRD